MGVSHHVAGARKQSPIHRIRKKMLPQMWQKLEVARSRVKCLLQPPEVSTGEKARALQPRVKAAGKGLERYRALALHTTSCILRGKLTRKFIPSERKDNERRRQLYFTSIERRQRAPEPAQDGIPRIPLTPPAHPQLQHPGRKQPITQESVPSVQLCAFHKAVYRCVGGKASHCCGVSEQSLSASGGHSIEGALQHNLLFQQFSCHAAEKADALPESGYCTQKDASPRVAHQGLSSLPNPRTPEVNVEESSIAGAEMPDPVHISPTNEFKQVLRTWKSKELQAAAYRKKGPMEQIQAVKGTGNSNGHVNKSGQAGNLQRATDEPQAIEVNKTTALADLVAPRATHKLKQPAAAEATIKLTPNMASKYVSQAAFAEPSEATPTDVLAAEPGGQSLQNSRTMDYRETVGLKEAVPRKPESIQSTTVLQKLGTNPFEVTEHSNRQTSEAESATKAEAADNDNRKATEAVGIMLEGKETPTACKKPCEEGRGEGHMRELGREQRTSKVLPTSGIGEEAQHKTSGTDSFVEVLPTKWEIFTLFLGSLFIYVLIFLCTRGVPHAILLLFCCLFGLRIRIGGSGSSSGGSYTALWLLVLQLLVLVAMCIISLVKQTANAEELLKQLENNRLYEADVRISKFSEVVPSLCAAYCYACSHAQKMRKSVSLIRARKPFNSNGSVRQHMLIIGTVLCL
ncbi:hypothetical protein, conserved [Eimeria tenella]|uniref:Uncharacterized protein n=1 Tax=Eimeria tenella TaxID=5802 RepID=U6KSZ3_EIMTE|nr:hypothetical protein, conserved [Eimeria tenella]CDJ41086.1 hypothetical protein, conserved [Eimeria tenella]|eukprot:XP_013231836.1 hypothetical protein, conserved [Eimeria tenella]